MSQKLRQEMQEYTNERIINNIKQKHYYSATSVAIAKEIAQERNLLSIQQISQLDKMPPPVPSPRSTSYSDKSSNNGIGVFSVLFIVFIIVKTIIRIAMYNN